MKTELFLNEENLCVVRWCAYLRKEVEENGAAAVGRDVLDRLDAAATHDDLRPVG